MAHNAKRSWLRGGGTSDAPEIKPRYLALIALFGIPISFAILYWVPATGYHEFVEGFYHPLVEGGPIIMVTWGGFGTPGFTLAAFLIVLLFLLLPLKLMSVSIPKWAGHAFAWAGIVSIILMIPVAKGGMWAASYHVTQNMGYEYCSALSRYEIGAVDRAYVKHRAFCYKPPRR